MAISQAGLIDDINDMLPTNSAGRISAQVMRQVLFDMTTAIFQGINTTIPPGLASGLVINQSPLGNVGENPFHYFNSILVNPYNAFATFNASIFGVDVTVNGANAGCGTGLATFGISSNILVNTQKPNAGSAWGGVVGTVIAAATMIGSVGGGIFGFNGNVSILPGVGGFQQITAGELDVAVGAGATGVLTKYGSLVLLAPADAVQGATNDAAYAATSASSSTPGWKFGYQVDTQATGQKVLDNTTGVAFGTRGGQTIGSAVDVSSATCLVAEWKSAHALIDGSGRMIVGAGAFTSGGPGALVVHNQVNNNLVVTANGPSTVNLTAITDNFLTAIALQISASNWTVDPTGNGRFNGQLRVDGGQIVLPLNGQNIISADGGASAQILFRATEFLEFQAQKFYVANASLQTAPDTTIVNIGDSTGWQNAYNVSIGAALQVVDPYGTGGAAFSSRTSDRRTGSVNPSTLLITTVHDNASAGTPASNVWGVFQIAWKTLAAFGSGAEFLAYELSAANFGATVVANPFSLNPADACFALRIDSGDGTSPSGIYDPSLLFPVTNAIDIIPNGNTFNAGIRFGNGAVNVQGGLNQAIQLPSNYALVWWKSVGPAITAALYTDASSFMQVNAVGGINLSGNSTLVAQITSAGVQVVAPGHLGVCTAPITSAFLSIAAGTTAIAQMHFVGSTAPTSPNDGDFWFDGTNVKIRVSGVTKTFTLT